MGFPPGEHDFALKRNGNKFKVHVKNLCHQNDYKSGKNERQMPQITKNVTRITLAIVAFLVFGPLWANGMDQNFLRNISIRYDCHHPLLEQKPGETGQYRPLNEAERQLKFKPLPCCAVWLAYSLDLDKPTEYILEAHYPTVDWIQPWVNDQPLEANGAAFPFDSRKLKSHLPTWHLNLDSGKNQIHIQIIDSTGVRRLPFLLKPVDEAIAAISSRNFVDGLLLGWLFSHILVALAIAIAQNKEGRRIGFLYFGYVTSSVLYQVSVTGHAFPMFWPSLPELNTFIQFVFAFLPFPLAAFWILSFQHADIYSPKIYRFFLIIGWVLLLMTLFPFLTLLPGFFQATIWIRRSHLPEIFSSILGGGVILYTTYLSIKLKQRESLIVIIGLSIPIFAAILAFGSELEMFKFRIESRNRVIQFATVIEYCILSCYLAIQIHRNLRDANSKQNRFSTALVNATDRERERIARELHDDVGQRLVALQFQMYNQPPSDQNTNLSQEIQDILQRLRHLAHTLHPPQLLNGHLIDALETQAKDLKRKGVCELLLHLDETTASLSGDTALHVLRIIQECTSNALRHAQATEIKIDSYIHRDKHVICIQNNGDPMPFPRPEGLGITSIRSRLRLLHGLLDIQSPVQGGHGARLILSFERSRSFRHV